MSIFDKVQVTTETDPVTKQTLVNCELRLRLSTFADDDPQHLEEAVRLCKKRFLNSLKHELYGEITKKLRELEVRIYRAMAINSGDDARSLLTEIHRLCDDHS